MYKGFAKLFHLFSRGIGDWRPPVIPTDPQKWPGSWVTIEYKSYPRLKQIPLPDVQANESQLFRLLSERTSHRGYGQYPITLNELSLLLKYGCGMMPAGGRAQPSGGGLYPIETYVMILFSHEIASGIYHYNVKDHALVLLEEKDFSGEAMQQKHMVYEWAGNASVHFFLTSVFERTEKKYGDRGYRYALLEAGHIGQNMYLVAGALGLKCIGVGGTRDAEIEKTLAIDGNTESLVYSITVGK